MAKKKAVKKEKADKKPTAKKKSPAGKLKVWHIVRFRERYEMPDDYRSFRKGPLYYTKDFVVNGGDDESASAYQQMCVLKSKPNRLVLRGAFADLKEIAANKSLTYRGYLLDEHFLPANDLKISHWLCVQIRTAKKILKDLEEIGLIEHINMPHFDLNDDKLPDKGKESKLKKDRKKDKKKTFSGNLRKSPEISGNSRKPLYIKDKDKVKDKVKDKLKEKVKEKAGSLTATGKNKDINKKKKTAKEKPNAEKKVPKNNPKRKGKDNTAGKEKTTQTPTAAPMPTKPKRADGEGKCHTGVETHDHQAPPPRRILNSIENKPEAERKPSKGSEPGSKRKPTASSEPEARRNPSRRSGSFGERQKQTASPRMPSDRFERAVRIYDPRAREFGSLIFAKLKVPHSPTSTAGKRELGNFAAAWSLAQSSCLGMSVLEELWHKAIKEAEAIGKRRRRATFTKGPEAVWRSIFNKRLDKAITEAGPARAVM